MQELLERFGSRARLRARLYTLTHRGTPGDVAFYRSLAQGRVLELGCGAGRITVPMAQAGAHVIGLDADPGMIALATEACAGLDVALVEGDMREFELPGRFDRVVIPYNALYALDDDDGIIATLRCAARHLAAGGLIVFDGYVVAEGDDLDEVDQTTEHLASILDQGVRIEVFEHERPVGRLHGHDAVYDYELTLPSGARHQETIVIQHHYIPVWRLPRILDAAGLRGERVLGDFAGGPLTDDSDLMVVLARAD